MPPKVAGKKADQKKKEKVIGDKTFGLKNKKGAKVQKFVQQVTSQVKHGNQSQGRLDVKKAAEKKLAADSELRNLDSILKPVVAQQKIDRDVDPKSVVCIFFKQGICHKGDRCKFSHDLSKERRIEKRNLYVDSRDFGKEDESESMNDWDEKKLKEVAEKKHGESDRGRLNQTNIVCKYFLEAVENNKYGWFWECPNGDSCIYRHALPADYVLKKDRKKLEELDRLTAITLEELIEKERTALDPTKSTRITLQSFIAWKKRQILARKIKVHREGQEKLKNIKSGKSAGMSGRDLFTYNPDLVGQDDDTEDGVTFDRIANDEQSEEECGKLFEIDERTFYNIAEDGTMLDDDIDFDGKNDPTIAVDSVWFTTHLFDAEDSDLCSDGGDAIARCDLSELKI